MNCKHLPTDSHTYAYQSVNHRVIWCSRCGAVREDLVKCSYDGIEIMNIGKWQKPARDRKIKKGQDHK